MSNRPNAGDEDERFCVFILIMAALRLNKKIP